MLLIRYLLYVLVLNTDQPCSVEHLQFTIYFFCDNKYNEVKHIIFYNIVPFSCHVIIDHYTFSPCDNDITARTTLVVQSYTLSLVLSKSAVGVGSIFYKKID